jgi:hypothetical protein
VVVGGGVVVVGGGVVVVGGGVVVVGGGVVVVGGGVVGVVAYPWLFIVVRSSKSSVSPESSHEKIPP